MLSFDAHAASADGGAQLLERLEGGLVSLVEAVATGQAGERRLDGGEALQGMERGDMAAELPPSRIQALAAESSRAVCDEASPREGAGCHELAARGFDGVVGHRQQDEFGSTRRLARGENRHLGTDPARGLLGAETVPSRDGGHPIAGAGGERADGGSHLAGSDDGDRRPFSPLRHGCAIGSFLDPGPHGFRGASTGRGCEAVIAHGVGARSRDLRAESSAPREFRERGSGSRSRRR